MLMAAGLPLPRKVFAHGWLLVGGEKMSKSKLTGIAPSQITDLFGSDAFRYYFLRAIPFGQDGSFSWEDMARATQAELAERLRQPRVARDRDGRPLLRRRAAGAAGSTEPALGRSARRRRSATPTRRSTGSTCRARIAAVCDFVARGERLHHRAGAVEAGEGRRTRRGAASTAVLYAAAEGCARSPCCSTR